MPLMNQPTKRVARCIGNAHCARREGDKQSAWHISADKKSLRKCCRFRNLLYLCNSWSRTRSEKPVDYQDVRGEFRHVPPAITQFKTPLFGGVFWFSFAKRFECQAFMFSITNFLHINIMITNLFFV